ncbi:polymorphic toxin type 50 domain-containing protein [Bacillus sp. FJAT-51639]|uniref:Polymorphic toxin type 50 domain-containing protein n=1 Tax=Bacillus bruguierae TaxID=3127667 RepID=A0ABU8FMA6_9BACI
MAICLSRFFIAFPNDFQSKVASTDVIEQEIREQIRGIDQTKAGMEGISNVLPAMQVMMGIFDTMKQKLQEKLEHLYEFNYTSSSNYDTALQLAASIAKGLAEVQSGKGFSPVSGTFSTQGLNMEWVAPIQQIAEEKAREAEIEREIDEIMALQEQEANRPWYQKTAIGAWEFFEGICNSAAENFIGKELPMGDELESKLTFQVGKLTGNVLSGAWSIVEMFAGLTLIGGSNFLTLAAGLVTAGGAIPIAVLVNGVLTVAGVAAAGHGGFVLYNTVQNSMDTIQRFQSSGGGTGTVNRIPSYGKNSVPKGPYREVNGYPLKVKAGAQEKHIPNTPNYKQEVANGKNKSIFYGDNKTAQELLDKFAGKGQLLKNGRERVDFGKPIGKYYDSDTGQYLETTRGLIHYGKDGAHIVPSEPLKK